MKRLNRLPKCELFPASIKMENAAGYGLALETLSVSMGMINHTVVISLQPPGCRSISTAKYKSILSLFLSHLCIRIFANHVS